MISRLIPIILVLAAAGLFFGYVQPTYSGSIATLTAENKDLDTALQAAKEFEAKEVELTKERSAIPADRLARLEAALPDSVDNVQLIVDLNSLAARSGVQLSQFDISKQEDAQPGAAVVTGAPTEPVLTDGEPTESLELSVSATGTYAAFRTFLDGVEKSLRPLDVVELSVQDGETGVYTYDVTFRLYWLR
jgi:Tfp pilus assembly protein PilO